MSSRRSLPRKSITSLVAIGLVAVALGSCGGSSSSESTGRSKPDRQAFFDRSRGERICFNTTIPDLRVEFTHNTAGNGDGPFNVPQSNDYVCGSSEADAADSNRYVNAKILAGNTWVGQFFPQNPTVQRPTIGMCPTPSYSSKHPCVGSALSVGDTEIIGGFLADYMTKWYASVERKQDSDRFVEIVVTIKNS
jgi:hypothetical protein